MAIYGRGLCPVTADNDDDDNDELVSMTTLLLIQR